MSVKVNNMDVMHTVTL